MKSSLGLFLLTVFLVKNVSAQSTITTTIDTSETRSKSRFGLQIDLNPLFQFNGGYGVGVSYDLSDRLSTEVSMNRKVTTIQDYSGPQVRATMAASSTGLRFNFFPFSTIQKGGFYTSLAVSAVDVNSEITSSALPAMKELNDQHTGRQIFAGYYFQPRNTGSSTKLTSRLGAGYGNGNKYVIQQGWNSYEVADSILLDASFLVVF
jgi:hypothetical protein